MADRFSLSIDRVVDLLGLVRDPRGNPNSTSYNVQCPFCDDKKFHLNIARDTDTYRCPRCGEGGGLLDLYARLSTGERCVSGKNSKEIYARLKADLGEMAPEPAKPKIVKVERASDKAVHNAYQALLDIPEFSLNDGHRENLHRRGLSDETIAKNGYKSFSMAAAVALDTKEAHEIYSKFRKILRSMPPIEYMKAGFLAAGFEIASRLQAKGIDLHGVPGFFMVQDRWCFRYEEGMAIPTRNGKGQIVGLQIRKDSGKIRYKTVSSKDLPEGVTTRITRTHFPLANAKYEAGTKVVLTEGPLKADVAMELDAEKKPMAFIAIQGVSNTADLPAIFSALRKRGVEVIYNALDMDRLINKNVAKACTKINEIAANAGLSVVQWFWDEERAKILAAELKTLCAAQEPPLEVPEQKNPFRSVRSLAKALHELDVEFDSEWNSPEEEAAGKKTKGIDDWFLYKRSQNQKDMSRTAH